MVGINQASPVNWAHPLNRGLVGWWMRIPGTSSGSRLTDLTNPGPSGHHGVLTNMSNADWNGADRIGSWGSLQYDDTSKVVDISGSPVLNYPFSMVVWFNSAQTASNDAIVSIADVSSGVDYHSLIAQGNVGGNPVGAQSRASSGITTSQTTTGYTVGQWHQAAGVYASATSRIAYIDAGSSAETTTERATNDLDHVTISGFADSSPGLFFDGKIDDFRLYNRALPAVELVELRRLSLQGYLGLLNRLERRAVIAAVAGGIVVLRRRYEGY